MKCVICRYGETSITLERDGTTIVIRNVPGEICQTCGEVYHGSEVTANLLQQAEKAYRDGIEVEIRNYRKAA